MSDKSAGLEKRYEVVKLSNPEKVVDAIVLEFDDPIARIGILAWVQEMRLKGYDECANDVVDKLSRYVNKEFGTNLRSIKPLLNARDLKILSTALPLFIDVAKRSLSTRRRVGLDVSPDDELIVYCKELQAILDQLTAIYPYEPIGKPHEH